jgi:hypothetical protein
MTGTLAAAEAVTRRYGDLAAVDHVDLQLVVVVA